MDAKAWIINWIASNMCMDKDKLLDMAEQNYIESVLMDSIGFITMISDAETHFDVLFSDEHMSDNAILTINGFADIIEKLKEGS